LPDATPKSTAPPSPARRNRLWSAAQLLLAAVVLYFVGKTLVGQWRQYRNATVHIELRWPYVLASGAVVLATYALLIEVWRRILREWRATIPFADAARIWFISILGQYVPGRVWQIVAMGKLAERENVPAAAAASSAIVNTVVQIAVGLAVAVIAGYRALDTVLNGHTALGIALTAAAFAGVLALPLLVPRLSSIARRVTGRNIDLGPLPPRAVYVAIVGNVGAWILYGWAFQLLVAGVLGRAPGGLSDYVAAYALSYVIGYLAFVMPAGAVVREMVQTTALTTLVAVNTKEAAIVAIVSRLWLTVLQVLPGLFYLARGSRTRTETPPQIPRDGSNLSS
jgi:hypothetical protein